MSNQERETLENLLTEASSEGFSVNLESGNKSGLNLIVEYACSGKNKAALAVVSTLFLKKILSPEQDIRLHQTRMPEGFSGRGLDTKHVTPFLREKNFPYMAGGSGWLTRSFEQAHPYYRDYPGSITPNDLKQSFLELVNVVQEGVQAEECLKHILYKLVKWRESNATLNLAKPTGKRIEDIVKLVQLHWQEDLPGAARLPVLTLYAVYKCLIAEVNRYKNCQLLELLSHTSADFRTDRIGDIDVEDGDSMTIETVEVKHKIPITRSLVEQLQEKIAGSGLKTFYILSTNERVPTDEMVKITELLLEIRQKYGCQVIVNGVACTIKYYLRLLSNSDNFVNEYVELVENDSEIPFQLKNRWNDIVG